MRCPKCGNEVDLKAMECARCGLATPKGQRPTGQSGKTGNTGRLDTGRLKKTEKTKTFLPKFLADLPLAKIKVPPKLIVAISILIPVIAVASFMVSTNKICIGCVQVGGQYSTELTVEDNRYQAQFSLVQTQGVISGQVTITELAKATNGVEAGFKTEPKSVTEIIQTGESSGSNVKFVTYPRNAGESNVQFSGDFADNQTLKGALKVNIPELNVFNKTFPLQMKREKK